MNDVTITVDGSAGPLECHVRGDGPAVVLLPSLGRGARDFDDLSTRLAEAGYRTLRPEPRGIGGSALGPDAIAVPENAVRLVEVIGDRARLVTIANAGHALLPEQPETVASTVLSLLRERVSGTNHA